MSQTELLSVFFSKDQELEQDFVFGNFPISRMQSEYLIFMKKYS